MPITSGKKFIVVMLVLAILLFAGLYYRNPSWFVPGKPYTITGKFVGFQYGDYAHAIYETGKGEIISTFMSDEGCFLALNKDDDLVVVLVNQNEYIPEAGGYETIIVAQSITTANSNKRWLRQSGVENETYAQNERHFCEKIQIEFLHREK